MKGREWKETECKVTKAQKRWGPFEEYRNENGQDARACCCNSGIESPYESGSFDNGQCNDYAFKTPGEQGTGEKGKLAHIGGDRWHDRNGFNCAVYEMMNWCKADGSEGDGWPEERFGPYLKQPRSFKRRASDACCACGGGMTEEDLPPVESIPEETYNDFDKYISDSVTKVKWVYRLEKECRKFVDRYVDTTTIYEPEEDLELIQEMCSFMDTEFSEQVARRMRNKLYDTSHFDD